MPYNLDPATKADYERIAARQSARDPEITCKTEHYVNDGVELDIKVFQPNRDAFPGPRPGILFFFGGGFRVGCPMAFREHAEICAKQGYISFSADYRVSALHKTTPRESILDGAAAWRYIRENADRWQLDLDRMAISGGSAGGLIALMCGPLSGVEPAALVLFNPGIKNVRTGGDFLSEMLPFQDVDSIPVVTSAQVDVHMPPTLIFHGEEDQIVPIAAVRDFVETAQSLGRNVRLIGYPGVGHGFFNFNRSRGHFHLTVGEMLLFLKDILDS